MLDNGYEAGNNRSATRQEALPQRLIQIGSILAPAVQVVEASMPTYTAARSVVDAELNDPSANELVDIDEPLDTTGENKKPKRRRTKPQGQGARQRKRLRDLRTDTPPDLISFDDDETASHPFESRQMVNAETGDGMNAIRR